MAMLGELETRVMEVLWYADEPRSVRAVHTQLLDERDLAYTTVMTVLDRLAKKGVVTRERDGRQWNYLPALTRARLVADEISELMGTDAVQRREVLAELASRLSPAERKQLA